jgi:hypothetical protein
MARRTTLSGVLMLIASMVAACGTVTPKEPGYPEIRLTEVFDPLVPARSFLPWHPPRQMAAFVHPHEDRLQGVMIGGHWMLLLLGEGRWYYEEEAEREPVPDAEASAEEIRRSLGALSFPRDAVVPFRGREGGKP